MQDRADLPLAILVDVWSMASWIQDPTDPRIGVLYFDCWYIEKVLCLLLQT